MLVLSPALGGGDRAATRGPQDGGNAFEAKESRVTNLLRKVLGQAHKINGGEKGPPPDSQTKGRKLGQVWQKQNMQ